MLFNQADEKTAKLEKTGKTRRRTEINRRKGTLFSNSSNALHDLTL